ncbi:failed axon connections homolog [Penaeus indicus]|uniref:failed axon connections homolog n=1 Tax=Penaeus indicus TaxID=29960 RepID=UPI00300CA1CE
MLLCLFVFLRNLYRCFYTCYSLLDVDILRFLISIFSVTFSLLCASILRIIPVIPLCLTRPPRPPQIDHEEPMGPKGKTPWITLNGEDMGDSQMIMEKLAAKFGKEFDTHLSQEEKAVAHSLRIMVDEYFVWCLGVYRYGQERGRHLALNASIPWFYRPVLAMYFKRYLEAAKTQGIGRHSYRDIEEMGRKSLQSLSAWLGEKPFMMGANPTDLDCSVFGMLAFDVFCPPLSPFKRMLEKDYRNLHAYCHRMKDKFWPDWDKCLDPHHH